MYVCVFFYFSYHVFCAPVIKNASKIVALFCINVERAFTFNNVLHKQLAFFWFAAGNTRIFNTKPFELNVYYGGQLNKYGNKFPEKFLPTIMSLALIRPILGKLLSDE